MCYQYMHFQYLNLSFIFNAKINVPTVLNTDFHRPSYVTGNICIPLVADDLSLNTLFTAP